LYRHPQALPALARLRAADFAVTELPRVAPPRAGAAGPRAPARQGAAFSYSRVAPPPHARPAPCTEGNDPVRALARGGAGPPPAAGAVRRGGASRQPRDTVRDQP